MNDSFRLHIVYYTDLHGRIISEQNEGKSPICGIDRLKGYLDRLKRNNERVLLIDNGDSIQGSHLVDCFDCQIPELETLQHPITIAHRELGVDCFVVGNHEFTHGKQRLDQLYRESNLPWLAANIVKAKDRKPYFRSYRLFAFGEYVVGVLGLTTERIPFWQEGTPLDGITFLDAFESARTLLPEIKRQCDFLVLAYHGGIERDPQTKEPIRGTNPTENQGVKLWDNLPEIDLLLLGHQHKSMLVDSPKREKAPLLMAGAKGRLWGHIILTDATKGDEVGSKLRIDRCMLVDGSKERPDRAFADFFAEHCRIVERYLEEFVGTAGEEFAIHDPMREVWLKRHPFIQWIQEVICRHANVDISATSLPEAEMSGLPRNVRRKDILENFRYANTVCVLGITGKILRQALERAASFFVLETAENGEKRPGIHPDWSRFKIRCNDYDMWHGIEYEFDLRRQIGNRLSRLQYRGREISDGKRLRIAVTTYRAEGTFYDMFSQKQIEIEFSTKITDLLIADLQKKRHLAVKRKQNFKILY